MQFVANVIQFHWCNYKFSGTVTTAAVTATFTPSTEFYGTSQPFYISAGTSAPTYTWATTKSVCSQEEGIQQISKTANRAESQIKVLIPEVISTELVGPLTPIRNAPPPPEQEQQFAIVTTANNVSFTNGHLFKTDIPVAEDLIPIQNHHPLHPHLHLKDQTTQPSYFQHGNFIICKKLFCISRLCTTK